MSDKKRDKQLAKRKHHTEEQNRKRAAALEVARASSDLRQSMEEQGYLPTRNGGWKRVVKPIEQPRKKQ